MHFARVLKAVACRDSALRCAHGGDGAARQHGARLPTFFTQHSLSERILLSCPARWFELLDQHTSIPHPALSQPPAPPQRPAAAIDPSPDGRRLRLTLPLRPGADGGAVVREVSAALQALARGSASCQQRQKVGAAACCGGL